MDKFVDNYAPRARQEDLVIEALGDETLVYDMRTHKAHCLNLTASLIWNHCDGKATASEMRVALERELHTQIDSDFVWLALNQLQTARLLSDPLPSAVSQRAMSRRAVIRKLGLGAAIALPLVTSVLAPTAEASGSCADCGTSCETLPCCITNACTTVNGARICVC
ncbi:MAG: hypothetical protein ACJ74J_03190 [Blastocatellia bacterium]